MMRIRSASTRFRSTGHRYTPSVATDPTETHDASPTSEKSTSSRPRMLLLYGVPWAIAIAVVIAVIVVKIREDNRQDAAIAAPPKVGKYACDPIKYDKRGVASFDSDACPPKGAKRYTGIFRSVSKDGFLLVQVNPKGILGETIDLRLHPKDAPIMDLKHWQEHALLGTAVSAYTQRRDGREYVVYLEDSDVVVDQSQRLPALKPSETDPG